jgi:hypothetical protein
MADLPGQLFLKGTLYYRQVGALSISLCVATEINDADWAAYLLAGLAITHKLGLPPRFALAAFVNEFPNAGQRGMLAAHMEKHRLPHMERAAVMSDNTMMRGAVTAFGWLVPKTKFRSFQVNDSAGAVAWLGEVAAFDRKIATDAWSEARTKLMPSR